jgi:ubiquinone/menaquinone biosynthesis C-methylase UbiE
MTAGTRKKERNKYRAAKVFNNHAAEYDSWFSSSLIYDIELAALQALQITLSKPKLEIGVGPGHFARDLGVGFGLDPAMAPLHLATQRGIKCFLGVGEELSLKNRSVGTIYLLFTLCFATDPYKIIRECRRALQEGGYLVVGMIPAESKWGKYLAAKKKADHVFYREANFYTIETVNDWLFKAGFQVVDFRSTLYQDPEQVEQNEKPVIGLAEDAGFVVIAARRRDA